MRAIANTSHSWTPAIKSTVTSRPDREPVGVNPLVGLWASQLPIDRPRLQLTAKRIINHFLFTLSNPFDHVTAAGIH
jgi:hypothetical protein